MGALSKLNIIIHRFPAKSTTLLNLAQTQSFRFPPFHPKRREFWILKGAECGAYESVR